MIQPPWDLRDKVDPGHPWQTHVVSDYRNRVRIIAICPRCGTVRDAVLDTAKNPKLDLTGGCPR